MGTVLDAILLTPSSPKRTAKRVHVGDSCMARQMCDTARIISMDTRTLTRDMMYIHTYVRQMDGQIRSFSSYPAAPACRPLEAIHFSGNSHKTHYEPLAL